MNRRLVMIGIVAGFCSTGVIAAEKNDYSDGRAWLCRPGRTDACTIDLNTTIVAADGALTREEFKPLANPPIDCFYVYPTVSSDPAANSDMNIDPARSDGVVRVAVRAVRRRRAALFAPMYRQVDARRAARPPRRRTPIAVRSRARATTTSSTRGTTTCSTTTTAAASCSSGTRRDPVC